MAELPVIKRLRKEAEQINRELTIDLPRSSNAPARTAI